MRQFVERWYGDDGVAFDVVFDPELARFDVVAGELVVFSHAAFVEILRWCMREDSTPYELRTDAIEVSSWEPDP
jgi:hypothetical protein